MLIQLPFFVGTGFCLGLLQRRGIALFFLALLGRYDRRAWMSQLLFVGLATLAGLALLRAVDEPGLGLQLQFAGLVVGWAGGRWFAEAPAGRDKAVFVAAAGVFVAVGALEYQYKPFGKLTDFSAGGVSLKFTDTQTVAERSVTRTLEVPGEPFRGRARLSNAVATLLAMPDYIERDEQYAELFSGYDLASRNASSGDDPAAVRLEPMTKQFLAFYCEKILPLAENLSVIHDAHKGEISSITLNPSLIAKLRISYESMLYPQLASRMQIEFSDSEKLADESPAFWSAKGLVGALQRTNDAITREVRILKPGWTPPPHIVCALSRDSPVWPPAFSSVGQYALEDAFAFVSYFAATAALAEFAIDNRERALQLLDDVILNGSPINREDLAAKADPKHVSMAIAPEKAQSFRACALLTEAGKPDKEGSPNRIRCEAASARLQKARRLTSRVRLETLEDALIELADNPDLTAIRISLLKRTVADMDALVDMLGGIVNDDKDARKFDKKAFFDARAGVSGAACSARLPADEPARGLLARWMTSLTSYRGNALESAADRADVVSANPALVPTLDEWAREVTSFNLDCVEPYLPLSWRDNLRPTFLVEAAGYWQAKGERFGIAANDEARLAELGATGPNQIGALCEARNSFQFAKQLYRTSGERMPSEYEMTLDNRAKFYSHPKIVAEMEDGYGRAKTALSQFPAAETEKACP